MALEAPRREDSGTPHTTVAVIGTGFAGLGAAVRLAQRGTDFTVFEKADDVGGTWRDNRYPGCQCDVPSHLYSFSFAPNPDWSRTYPTQPEIWEYLRVTAARFGVVDRIRFGHEVLAAAWDDATVRWRIETSHGPWTARVLVAAVGPLSAPAVPDIPGLGDFAGTVFHSATWDEAHDLAGERVGVVGTGASAVQIVPHLAPDVARLTVFQRTAPWVLPHTDRPLRPWERTLYRRVPALQRLVRWGIYWLRELAVLGMVKRPGLLEGMRRRALRHLERQVPDPGLRAKLTPRYAPGCKRLLLSNDYYPALTRPNVAVVTEPIEAVTAEGVRTADGTVHRLDTIVLGTGFAVVDHPAFDRVRSHGVSLADVFARDGMAAYLGATVPGFPNFMMLAGPNTGIGHTSLVFMIEAQLAYLLGALDALEHRRAAWFDVRPEPFAAYNRELQEKMAGTVWLRGGCASWYLDAAGRNPTLWPDWTWRFHLRTRRFDPADYRFGAAATPAAEPAEPAGTARAGR